MATKDFSTVPTVATNDQWTAAQHNQYIRDNFDALHEVPLGPGDEQYDSVDPG